MSPFVDMVMHNPSTEDRLDFKLKLLKGQLEALKSMLVKVVIK